MKKYLLFALLAFTIFACSDKKDEKKEEVNFKETPKITKPTGPLVKLQYKFRKGDKFKYKLQTISDNMEEINADTTITNNIKQNTTYKFNFVVKDVKPDKSADIEVRINSIVVETDFNGQKVNYDSKYIYSSREKIQFVDYEAVKKVPFRITVNQLGQVTEVRNVTRIMNNILQIQNIPDTLSKTSKEKMKLNISNGTLMPLTQQIFKVVSEDSVGVGSKWELKYNTPLGVFNVENTAIFNIKDLLFEQDTLATITSTLLINATGNNVVNEQGVRYTFSKPLLTASGNVVYNFSKGLVEKAESNTKLEMAILMEGLDQKGNPLQSTKKNITNNKNIVELL